MECRFTEPYRGCLTFVSSVDLFGRPRRFPFKMNEIKQNHTHTHAQHIVVGINKRRESYAKVLGGRDDLLLIF